MSSRGESRAGSGRRRRRTPEAAEREIVEAAEALLRERPFRELTVDDLMRRTGLSRPSFYVYFRDRHDLVLRVVEHIGGELFAMSERWYEGTGDGPALVREAIEGVVGVFAEHGPVLRALADAAADDPRVEAAYVALIQRFVDATARHIEEEIAAGRVLPLDPVQTATALTWMMERYLQLQLGAHAGRAGRAASPDTLTTIWSRVLYGAAQPQLGLKPGGSAAEPPASARGADRPPTVLRPSRERSVATRSAASATGAGDQPRARRPRLRPPSAHSGAEPEREIARAEAGDGDLRARALADVAEPALAGAVRGRRAGRRRWRRGPRRRRGRWWRRPWLATRTAYRRARRAQARRAWRASA